MRKLSTGLTAKQAGFTLIELIIVIVIIGILAAVAIPRLGNVTGAANQSTNTAVLGAVRSAYTTAFALARVAPTAAQIATQTEEPQCVAASTTSISCPVGWLSTNANGGNLLITYDGTTVGSLLCTTAADCL